MDSVDDVLNGILRNSSFFRAPAQNQQSQQVERAEVLPVYVRRLPTDSQFTSKKLFDFFTRYGQVKTVRLNKPRKHQPVQRRGLGLFGNTGSQTSSRLSGDGRVYFAKANPDFASSMLNGEVKHLSFSHNGQTYTILASLDRTYQPPQNNGRHVPHSHNPRFSNDTLTLDSGGFTIGNLFTPHIFYEQWSCSTTPKLVIDYADNQTISIVWPGPGGDIHYKVEYKFKNVRETFALNQTITGNMVTYDIGSSLLVPPSVYYRKQSVLVYSEDLRDDWYRIAFHTLTDIQDLPASEFYKGTNLERVLDDFPNTGAFMDHHYKVTFVQNSTQDKDFQAILGRLEQFGLVLPVHLFRHVGYKPRNRVPRPFDVFGSGLPFAIKFKLMSLISFSNITAHHIDAEFLRLLLSVESDLAEGALEDMLKPRERIWDPKRALRACLDNTDAIRLRISRNRQLNVNQRLIRKIVVTPTRILYLGPQLELSNRILRAYGAQHDNFIRVNFCDEELLSLPGNNFFGINDLVFKRIQTVLDAGTSVCGRQEKFDFLHYSNSSLRTGGCWFLRPFHFQDGSLVNSEYIQGTLGTFMDESNPALRGARMAQCFTSTTLTGQLLQGNIKIIPDVVSRNGLCFSDGVGRIGTDVAAKHCLELKKFARLRGVVPSAYQFRIGGAKGVLTLVRGIPPNEIHLRQSQKKFESDHNALEICRTSFFSPGFLNHQFIILMETQGITISAFESLRDEIIEELDRALVNPTEAVRVLNENADNAGFGQLLITMIKSGLLTANEPFLMNNLALFRGLQLRNIKQRGKILVKKSANLIGVMDETGLLPEGQIFVAYTDPISGSKKLVQGTVAIMRAPALHPGDLQVVRCVDIPALHYLVDVVVFSQHGQRPLPNMLSGGDLDGDTFFVTWDRRLIPQEAARPMVYSTAPVTHIEDMDIDTVKKHFVRFLKNNNLGSIDNAWKAWADQCPEGAHAHQPLRLAELHSDAVDFAKKGKIAIMTHDLRPKKWPDYMEKPAYQRSYESDKAAGVIYRSVDVKIQLLKDFPPLPHFKWPGYEEYLSEARALKSAYDREICALMNQYEIKSEFELVSGFIFHLAPAAVNNRRGVEARDVVMRAVHTIKKNYRQLFWTRDLLENDEGSATIFANGVFHDNGDDALAAFDMQLSDAIYAKAAAWYMAAYDMTGDPIPASSDATPRTNDIAEDERIAAQRRLAACPAGSSDRAYQTADWDMSGRFYSFPWLMYDVLCNLYHRQEVAAAV
ncbi:RNA dependent RNA polymerase-domain-containing protein [Phlyctochytrium arcticum]|nr:RNA dependent RNA polymerase-domain-containing protein [Phlyctochytrium arcticum]